MNTRATERTTSPTPGRTVVFYDGGCPLCSREIGHYRRLSGAEQILWVDISEEETALNRYGLSREDAMARFHVRGTDGRWHIGAHGFAELWSRLPAYRWLASALQVLRLLPALDLAYARFARWRMRNRCVTGSCATRRGH